MPRFLAERTGVFSMVDRLTVGVMGGLLDEERIGWLIVDDMMCLILYRRKKLQIVNVSARGENTHPRRAWSVTMTALVTGDTKHDRCDTTVDSNQPIKTHQFDRTYAQCNVKSMTSLE